MRRPRNHIVVQRNGEAVTKCGLAVAPAQVMPYQRASLYCAGCHRVMPPHRPWYRRNWTMRKDAGE